MKAQAQLQKDLKLLTLKILRLTEFLLEKLFSSQGMKDYIGGVILFDETIRQKSSEGIPIPELIKIMVQYPV